jgi:AcrR family transcriptional regulator
MHARGPDIDEILGPVDPPDDAHKYLHAVVVRLAEYFGEVIPLGLQLMMHPSFHHSSMTKVQTGGPAELKEGLARRLTSLARRGCIEFSSAKVTARLLVSLAHDWALGHVMSHAAPRPRELKEMIDVVWAGLRPR